MYADYYQRQVDKAEAWVERMLDMAERFPHNPELEAKFLRQAIEGEQKLHDLTHRR
jgi:hypothetical protein